MHDLQTNIFPGSVCEGFFPPRLGVRLLYLVNLVCRTLCDKIASVTSLCHAVLRGLGRWKVCWGGSVPLGNEKIRNAGVVHTPADHGTSI